MSDCAPRLFLLYGNVSRLLGARGGLFQENCVKINPRSARVTKQQKYHLTLTTFTFDPLAASFLSPLIFYSFSKDTNEEKYAIRNTRWSDFNYFNCERCEYHALGIKATNITGESEVRSMNIRGIANTSRLCINHISISAKALRSS